MTEPDLKQGTIDLLTFWLPADEVERRKHVAEVVERLWDKGIRGMIGSACSLAAGLHLIDKRINCALHLDGFDKDRGMVALICRVGPATILPGCLALWGTCGQPETYQLTPAELQSDLSLAKPVGAEPVPLADVTAAELRAIVNRLIALAAAAAKPQRKRPWWARLWG